MRPALTALLLLLALPLSAPAQALAYKIGELKIKQLRAEATQP